MPHTECLAEIDPLSIHCRHFLCGSTAHEEAQRPEYFERKIGCGTSQHLESLIKKQLP
jgi:hypothetical protein